MSDGWDSDNQRRKFAEKRSDDDARFSNENIRATSQAVILINGGAATAILAFLAKSDIPSVVQWTAPFCLMGYALGVLLGACSMYFSTRSLDCYQLYWRLTAHPEAGRDAAAERANGYKWLRYVWWSFYGSMAVFMFSSFTLGFSLFCARTGG
jgi:hypothetical protein